MRQLVPYVVAVGVAFAAFVAFDHFVLRTAILTPFEGRPPLSPLYAFWMPLCRPAAVLFPVVALAVSALVPRLLSERTSAARFGMMLLGLALALPLALFVVRDAVSALGSQFLIYRGEEYFDDARRIVDLGGFIRHYPELAPVLSLHGRVHPPGFACFLYVTGLVAGPSPLAAGIAVLLAFAGGVLLAWRAFAVVLDRRGARVAALLLLAVPSLLDFACTSMDAVFFTVACLVILVAFRSLSDTGRWWHAALAGPASYLAMFCSFSAIPLGLFVLAYGAGAWWRERSSRTPVQLGTIAVSFIATYLIVRLATGFDLWESFTVARQQHYEIMKAVTGTDVRAIYVPVTFGNCAAVLIGSGLALVPPVVRSAGSASGRNRWLALTAIVTLGVLCAAGVYTMETERILMFAMPWLALAAVAGDELSDSAVRLMLGVGWAQAFAMEALLFTLW